MSWRGHKNRKVCKTTRSYDFTALLNSGLLGNPVKAQHKSVYFLLFRGHAGVRDGWQLCRPHVVNLLQQVKRGAGR